MGVHHAEQPALLLVPKTLCTLAQQPPCPLPPPYSERLARSQAEGQRAKEACSINKSLSSLGDVFQALASKTPHIPYRNSKLTHLLQPCLGGSGKTLMVVNVSPDPDSAQETLCSLRFGEREAGCAWLGGLEGTSAVTERAKGPSSRQLRGCMLWRQEKVQRTTAAPASGAW